MYIVSISHCHSFTTAYALLEITSSISFQPSLLSAEPLLPPHNFHSHSLRRLPLYQPLHISQPMPLSLSVGQPTLPPLPAHYKVLPTHASSSPPPRVQPFLSLPRQQSSYRVEQVCLNKKKNGDAFFFLNTKSVNSTEVSIISFVYLTFHSVMAAAKKGL